MNTYLGLRYFVWALIFWVAVAGTFGVILLYRVLVRYREEDELFIPPAELRKTLEHLRHVDRMAIGFGAASVIFLVLIAAGWSLGVL